MNLEKKIMPIIIVIAVAVIPVAGFVSYVPTVTAQAK